MNLESMMDDEKFDGGLSASTDELEGTEYTGEIEVRLDPELAESVHLLAKQGYLGGTPEAVIEHCIRQFLFEAYVRCHK